MQYFRLENGRITYSQYQVTPSETPSIQYFRLENGRILYTQGQTTPVEAEPTTSIQYFRFENGKLLYTDIQSTPVEEAVEVETVFQGARGGKGPGIKIKWKDDLYYLTLEEISEIDEQDIKDIVELVLRAGLL